MCVVFQTASNRSVAELISCTWILIHGVAVSTTSVLTLVDLISEVEAQQRNQQDSSKTASLSSLLFHVLEQVVRYREFATRLLQVLAAKQEPRRGGKKKGLPTCQKSTKGEHMAGIHRSLSSLWRWLGYEACHRPGFLRLLLDGYTQANQLDTRLGGVKSTITTMLCFAWGVLERRNGIDTLQRRTPLLVRSKKETMLDILGLVCFLGLLVVFCFHPNY